MTGIGSESAKAESEPYDAVFFAAKHGLSEKAARTLLYANGPSRIACDAAARSFLEAVAGRSRKQP